MDKPTCDEMRYLLISFLEVMNGGAAALSEHICSCQECNDHPLLKQFADVLSEAQRNRNWLSSFDAMTKIADKLRTVN